MANINLKNKNCYACIKIVKMLNEMNISANNKINSAALRNSQLHRAINPHTAWRST